jgi:hypothetical protein
MSHNLNQTNRQASLALADGEELLMFADGYDEAILGIAELNGNASVVYDRAKVIKILRHRDGMTQADAEEFFAYNIAGAFMGESSPVFLQRIRPDRGQGRLNG